MPVFIEGITTTGPDSSMSTSFEAYGIGNAIADHNAFLVAEAQDSGFIVIGETNPEELYGFKDQIISPGWSALGGEIISPYDSKVVSSRTDESLAGLS